MIFCADRWMGSIRNYFCICYIRIGIIPLTARIEFYIEVGLNDNSIHTIMVQVVFYSQGQ